MKQLKLVLLFLPLMAVIALSGASILDSFDQRKVETIQKCIEKGSTLDNLLQKSIDYMILQCGVPVDIPPDYRKYIEVDLITGQLTCKDTAPWNCRNSVKVYGLIWAHVWGKVPDPSICYQYEDINTFLKSCEL